MVLMRLYARKHLMEVVPGSSSRKRNLLDVARFLKFAVNKYGADKKWLPLVADDLKELIGHRQTAPKPTVPIKPEELMVLFVDDGNLKIGNANRNVHS